RALPGATAPIMAAASSASLDRFRDDIARAADEALARLDAAPTVAALEEVRVAALGKKGTLSALLRQMGAMDPAERPAAGALVNAAKERVAALLDARRADLARREAAARLDAETLDISLPGTRPARGHLHP